MSDWLARWIYKNVGKMIVEGFQQDNEIQLPIFPKKKYIYIAENSFEQSAMTN